MLNRRASLLAIPVAVLAGSFAVLGSTGCSSKPAFCSDLDSFKSSVSQLVKVERVDSSTLDEVQADFDQVEQNATDVIDSARADFPQETGNLEDQIAATTKSFEDLPSNPEVGDYVAIGLQVASLVKAASDFENRASSACN